jgi:hypothetical protein
MKHVLSAMLDLIHLNALWLRIVRECTVCVRKVVNIHHGKFVQCLGLMWWNKRVHASLEVCAAVWSSTLFFWDVTLEDESTKFLRHVGNQLPSNMASYPRRRSPRTCTCTVIIMTLCHSVICKLCDILQLHVWLHCLSCARADDIWKTAWNMN